MAEDGVASSLALVPWLAGVESEVIARLARQSRCVNIAAGTVFVHRNQPLTELCVVGSGAVASSLTNAKGKRLVVSTYERGQAFGLNPVLDAQPAVYDSETTEASQLIWIPRSALIAGMEASPALMMAVVLELCARSRDLLSIINDRSLSSGSARVARYLLILSRRHAPSQNQGRMPQVALTQNVLADMMGITRTHLNTELRSLEKLELVRTGYGAIELLDVAGLKSLIAAQS